MTFDFSFFIFSVSLLFLIVATIYDVTKRIVPNFLIFYLLILGFITKVVQAIVYTSFNIFLNSLLSVIITFVVCYILWEVGFFAGGDLKLFVALSLLNPFNLNFFSSTLSLGVISTPIFALTLIIVSILSTAPLLILYSLYFFFFRGHYVVLYNLLKSKGVLFSLIGSVLILFLISSFLNIFSLSISPLLYILFSIAFLLIFRGLEKYDANLFYYIVSFFYILLILFEFFSKQNIFSLMNFLTILASIFTVFLAITMYRIISANILTESKPVSSLKEGDVVVCNYYKVGSKTFERKVSFFEFVSFTIKNKYSKNLIIDSRKAGGLSLEDITFLKSSYNDNLEKEVLLKKTLPFTPSVLVAFLLLNFFGDFIWLFF